MYKKPSIVISKTFLKCPGCEKKEFPIDGLTKHSSNDYCWSCTNCLCKFRFTYDPEIPEVSPVITAVEENAHSRVMDVYRISSDKGETFFMYPGIDYSRLENYKEYHDHQRFVSEVNTSVINLFMGSQGSIHSYSRETGEFSDDDGGIVWYVGHLPYSDYLKIVNNRDTNKSTIIELVVEEISKRLGVDLRTQFKTQQYGPTYWEED